MSLFVVACSGETGPAGEQGAQGAQGPQGAKGSDGKNGVEVGWADATGTVIPGLHGNVDSAGLSPTYIDPQTGLLWKISVETGLLTAEGGALVWTTDDCTGTPSIWAYWNFNGNFVAIPPRVVFSVNSEFRVRKDDVTYTGAPPAWASTGDDTQSCSTNPPPGFGLTATETTVVTKPTLTLTPPLHPVLTTL